MTRDPSPKIRISPQWPVEVTEALLARIERLDGRLHAFLKVDAEGSRAAARQAEHEIAQGRWRGPLHGVAIAIKDIVDVEGQVTTCHSKIPPNTPAQRDAPVITRLRQAGAILIGRTALHEFATGGPAFDLPWPPARNPWNPAVHPGGSSSGSGAAVAAGMVPAALGTDTGGSVRNPGTCCGLLGLKPTYDLISREGVFPLSYSLDHVGFLTRDAEDQAILLDACVTPRTGAPSAYHQHLLADRSAGLRGLRIGVAAHFHEDDDPADVAVVRGIDAALDVLRELGARVERVKLAPLREWQACGRVIQQAEQYAVHEAWLHERPQDYCAMSREKLLAGANVSGADYVRATLRRQALRSELEAVFAAHDAVVAVSSMTLPCAIDDPQVSRSYVRNARMPFNLTGTPALAMPVGFTDDGLPLGLQLAGAAGDERMLLRIADAYGSATRWHERRPPL